MPGILKVGSVLLIAVATLAAATIAPTRAAPQSRFEGTTEYLPPLKGQSMVGGGRFTFLFGPAIAAQAGDTLTWVVVDQAGKVTNRGRSVRIR